MPAPETNQESTLAIAASDVEAAAERIAGVAHRTPVASSQTLDRLVGARVFVKCENHQRTGSFKFRGAYNRLVQIPMERRGRGVVAMSSGNHAQAVALAARLLGIPATIVMPTDAPASKRAATEGYGAQVVPFDRARERREDVTARVVDELSPAAMVPPYDDPDVMAGQGTAALELLSEVGDLDVVVVPLGGGGLLSGWSTAVRAACPNARIYGVETTDADDWSRSFAAGRPVSIDPPHTIADGIRTEEPGRLTWPVVRRLVDDVVVIDDDAVGDALRFAVTRMKHVVEPTGAVALAALMSGAVPGISGARVGTVFSGGNVDRDALARLLAE